MRALTGFPLSYSLPNKKYKNLPRSTFNALMLRELHRIKHKLGLTLLAAIIRPRFSAN